MQILKFTIATAVLVSVFEANSDGNRLSAGDRLSGRRADGSVSTSGGVPRLRRSLDDFNRSGENPQFVLNRVQASTRTAADRLPTEFQNESATSEWRRQILRQLDFDSNDRARNLDFHGNPLPPRSPGVLVSYFGAYEQFTRETLATYQQVLPAGTIATDDPFQAFQALQERSTEIKDSRADALREIKYQQARGNKVRVKELTERLAALNAEDLKLNGVLKQFGKYFAFLEELEKTSAGSTLVFRAAHQDMMMFQGNRVQGIRFTIDSMREWGTSRDRAGLNHHAVAEWETHLRAARIDRAIFRNLARLRNPAMAVGGLALLGGASAAGASEQNSQAPKTGRPLIRTSPTSDDGRIENEGRVPSE